MLKDIITLYRYICLLIISLALSILSVSCKTGSNSYKKTEVDVYAGGNFRPDKALYNQAGYWKNGNWITLYSAKPAGVSKLFVSNKNVYAFGARRTDIWDSNNYEYTSVWGYWKNGKWFEPTPIDKKHKATAHGLFVSGDDVYLSGTNEKGAKTLIHGYWKNGEWKSFPYRKNIYTSGMSVITVSNNDVYAGWGYAHGYYKNDTMVELPVFEGAMPEAGVKFIAINGNDVYAGGYCLNKQRNLIAGYWKNSVWIPLMPEDSTDSSIANSIFIYNKDIYIGGNCTKSSRSVAGYWKNSKWVALPPLTPNGNSDVLSLVVFEGDVYAAGYSNSDSGYPVAGYWKNGVWVGLSDGKYYAEVKSIVVVPHAEVCN